MIRSSLPYAIALTPSTIDGDNETLLPWWSITKTVLAVAALRLVGRGRLDLDRQIDRRPYTLRQLLQHTAGLTTYGGPAYHDAVAAGAPPWSVDELLARCRADELLFTPGRGWAYSNIGYLYVRQIIETATASPIDKALNELVFDSIGVAKTHIAQTPADFGRTRWSNPHHYDPGWVYHGLLIGPPVDAVRFLSQLLDGALLSPPLVAVMQKQHPLGGQIPGRPWTETGYGLGMMIGRMGDAGRAIGHSGGGPSSVSALYSFPDVPGQPVIATFSQGPDEGVCEHECVRLAMQTTRFR